MHAQAPHRLWLLCCAAVGHAWGEGLPADSGPTVEPDLVWSLGMQVKMDDMRHAGPVGWRPMIGLRYGRWRSGAVDGESWHRFGQVRTDNTLTYDLPDTPHWRTSLSAGIVNLQRDATFDAFLPGRKTVRGRAGIEYMGWPHWSAGLILTQDLLGRGAGTALSPSVTYRQRLTDDSTILLSHGFNFARSELWRYTAQPENTAPAFTGSRWGSTMDSSLTLRQRWKPHWSWFAQLNRSQRLRTGDPFAQRDTHWAGQAGVIYFEH